MSAFLGPIHDKMFARITFLETIERYIYNEGMAKFGESINTIRLESEELYGGSSLGYSIEEVVDTANIHGSLQELVTNVEKRHNHIIAKLISEKGDDGKQLLLDVYKKIGGLLSSKIKTDKQELNAPILYDFLDQYFLDGMPCNSISGITKNNEKELTWIFANALHKDNFLDTDVSFYYELRKQLVNALLGNITQDFAYTYAIETIDNNELYLQSIIRL